ncbi:50S ribosomal protein L3 [candidate division MSBL1 archaeon SCGC-AAA261G05]|uniref:Large ribosomal subunit protein uL3 n=4 Tax=candidate division MSBL1 TaxID=215777 RepID=A0A133V195_9EURY|nr:50S ribosomal protein L3 [candidate division MSBL1 archaeon SCGC-AAA261C02]KXB04196.1 50S ribosomal protein L3 [candidate division MSBL1 archaeon SCGC-AAA261G05]KXB09050.1 50S ribosomal protein L3 [candidate division MSBL1 archaeon SCGC-AAA833K04]
MPEKSHPRRGSLAYTPKKRAKSQKPRIRAWPEGTSVQLLGFPGYKAGMTQIFMIDDHDESITRGQEISVPVTIIETPPVIACAIRIYGSPKDRNRAITEVWAENLSKDLTRELRTPKEYDQKEALKKAEELLEDQAGDVRLLVHTQPRKSSLSKKKPEILELQIGGDPIMDKWEYAKEALGNEIKVSDVFEEGKYVDAIAVTKGKGTEGPVQRWGVKVQPRKVQQARRHVGTLGPWRPRRIMRSVPNSGQMGYHQRTDCNKRILKMGEDGSEVTPNGGFLRYGPIREEFVMLAGSTPGTTKRLVCLRQAMRPKKGVPTSPPTITHVDTSSQQGG